MATKIGQAAQELSRLNPWWRDPDGWAAVDPDLTEARRASIDFRSDALAGLEPGSLYVLRGPRRVGKTVLLAQTIDGLLRDGVPPTSIIRVAVDGWDAKDLRTLTQNIALPPLPPGVARYWFIDEISAVRGDWAQQIKWLRDNDPGFRAATVILTGSNAAALTEASGALAGRRGDGSRLDRTLLPIGFRTFATLLGAAPPVAALPLGDLTDERARESYGACLPWLDELVRLWERYLLFGGFPKAVSAAKSGVAVPASFVDALFDVISADAFRHSRLAATTEMDLLERLWQGIGAPANMSSIAERIGTTPDVVARHADYLRDSFLLWACPQKADDAWLPKRKAQPKLYAIDPLIARLAHLRNPARADIDPTMLTEMQLGLAVRRRALADRPATGNDEFLFYVRTPARKEIDFVAAELQGTAIEGKYVESGAWAAEAATVNASQWRGILATRNVLDTPAEGAWAVPAGILAYLLDT